jgi:acyl-coenzyme A thioesterase PaaI-like protein
MNKTLEKAKKSSFYLWLLNLGLDRMIPFNKPHGFRVEKITDNSIQTRLPYKRRNFNHIRGLHACALATLSEFTTGFLLVSRLDPSKYRIILKTLEMEYHYQGKKDARGSYEITDEWLEQYIYEPLKKQDATVVICEIRIMDSDNNHLTTGKVHWQVKSWQKVRTKVD